MRRDPARAVLLCAFLAAGLLFDPMGFLRMTIFCALVHEGGHILAYVLCLRRWPRLRACIGGITLCGAERLSRAQELFVLCAGPAANFLLTALLLWRAFVRASYRVYFLAAVSLCTGLYNLLPLGVLDGARILQNLVPAAGQGVLHRAEHALLYAFCTALLLTALCCQMPAGARAAALLSPTYLLMQDFLHRR